MPGCLLRGRGVRPRRRNGCRAGRRTVRPWMPRVPASRWLRRPARRRRRRRGAVPHLFRRGRGGRRRHHRCRRPCHRRHCRASLSLLGCRPSQALAAMIMRVSSRAARWLRPRPAVSPRRAGDDGQHVDSCGGRECGGRRAGHRKVAVPQRRHCPGEQGCSPTRRQRGQGTSATGGRSRPQRTGWRKRRD